MKKKIKKSNDHVRLAIIKARNNVQKKYQAMKSELIESNLLIEKNFKPIIDPLKTLIENKKNLINTSSVKNELIKREIKHENKNKDNSIKNERDPEPEYDNEEFKDDALLPEEYDDQEKFGEHENFDDEQQGEKSAEKSLLNSSVDDDDDLYTTVSGGEDENDTESDYNSFNPSEYINDVKLSMLDYDRTYGVRYENNEYLLGNSSIQFDDKKNVVINGKTFLKSPGLYELLFKKLPDKNMFSEIDLLHYKDIGIMTSLFYRKYDKNTQINGNPSKKYTQIVSKLVEKKNSSSRKRVGKSLKSNTLNKNTNNKLIGVKMNKKKKNIDSMNLKNNVYMNASKPMLIYWDDVNEIINRLRLIVSSTIAGNNSHQNEIISIIEELRESDYIE